MFPRPIYNPSAETPRPTVTWNPAVKGSNITLSGGNLVATKTTADATQSVLATYGIPHTQSGYFEVEATQDGLGDSPFVLIGISTSAITPNSDFIGGTLTSWGYYQQTGDKFTNSTNTAFGNVWTTGQVLSVAFRNGLVWFGKQGAWQASGVPETNTNPAYSGITGTIFPGASIYRSTAPSHIITGRFKLSDFSFTPPTGFRPWGT